MKYKYNVMKPCQLYQTDTSLQKTHESISVSPQIPFESGLIKEESNVSKLERKDLTDSTRSKTSLKDVPTSQNPSKKKRNPNDEKSVIVESLLETKRMILDDRKNTSDPDIQTTSILKTLEAVLISRGKDLKPFWNKHSKGISKNLWLPTKTDSVVSDLTCLNSSLKSYPGEKSWFSTTVKVHPSKNLSPTFYQSSTSSRQGLTDLESTKQKLNTILSHIKNLSQIQKEKPFQSDEEKAEDKEAMSRLTTKKKQLKSHLSKFMRTKRYILKLSNKQKTIIDRWFGIYRWFYNRTVDYCETNKKYSFMAVRNNMRDDETREFVLPDWWTDDNKEALKVPPRLISGSIQDCCKAYKTSFSLVKKKIIHQFKMHYKTKKDKSQTLSLEKSCFSVKNVLFPSLCSFGTLHAYHKKSRKKFSISNLKIKNDCRISFKNGRYHLLIPEENECSSTCIDGDWVSIDSGCRTFQSCYCPNGHTVEIGPNMNQAFKHSLNKIDAINALYSKATHKGRKRRLNVKVKREYENVKNRVDDLHWKTIKLLTSNYSTVVISDFKVSELLKNKRLNKFSKRLLQLQSHYKFRCRLIEKCFQAHSQLFIVDESYTSKTCSCCGTLNHNLGSSKQFDCSVCKAHMDRDLNASRNMFIKHSKTILKGEILYLNPFSPPVTLPREKLVC